MKIKSLLETIFTGLHVVFFSQIIAKGKYSGNKVMCFKDDETKTVYFIYESLSNFTRFKDWEGKKAEADVQPAFSKTLQKFNIFKSTQGLKMIPANIRTEVEVDDKKMKNSNDFSFNDLYDL